MIKGIIFKKTRWLLPLLFFISVMAVAQSNSLVVMDKQYAEADKVAEQLPNTQILYLDANTNPWKQIRMALEADRSIVSIHLFVKATYNGLLMGEQSYTLESLDNEFELGMLEGLYQGTHIQLLVYNCNIGNNQDGQELLRQIGQRAYFNVAVPTDCNSIFDSGFNFDYTTLDLPITESIIQQN